jgi:ATP-dependent Lhr-like helicase
MAHEVWSEYYDRLAELAQAHRTTLVFVNTRKLAERVARHLSERLGEEHVATHHGSLSKESRLDAETRLKAAGSACLGRHRVAGARHRHRLGGPGVPDRLAAHDRCRSSSAWAGRATAWAGCRKGRVFPETRDDLVECVALVRAVKRGDLDAFVPHDAPLDVLTQQIVAETARPRRRSAKRTSLRWRGARGRIER